MTPTTTTTLRLTIALWCAALAAAAWQVRAAMYSGIEGLDVRPLYHAGEALTAGGDVYADPLFVYPPSAAPLGAALAVLPFRLALWGWVSLSALALLAACATAAASFRHPWRWSAGGALAVLLACSDLFAEALPLANISVLMVPVAVLIAGAWARDRTELGGWMLAATCLVKPLLAPMALVPALAGAWRGLVRPVAAGAAVLGAAVLVVPGGERFLATVGFLAGGSTLTGDLAAFNLSLAGLADNHGWPTPVALAARAIAAAVAAVVVWTLARRGRPGDTQAACAAALLGVFLAGSLSESHFVLIPMLLVAAAVAARSQARDLAALLPVALLLAPIRSAGVTVVPDVTQVRWIVVQLLLLAFTAWVARARTQHRPTSAPPTGPVAVARPAA